MGCADRRRLRRSKKGKWGVGSGEWESAPCPHSSFPTPHSPHSLRSSKTIQYGQLAPMALCFPLCGDGFADRARVLRLMFVSMIAGTNERARLDVAKSHLQSSAFEFGELLRRVISLDRKPAFGGLQILAHRQDVAIHCAQVAHRFDDLLGRLAEADHDTGFGQHPAPFAVAA